MIDVGPQSTVFNTELKFACLYIQMYKDSPKILLPIFSVAVFRFLSCAVTRIADNKFTL